MDNNVKEWLSKSFGSRFLQACFVDCQGGEYDKIELPFFRQAQVLAVGLRTFALPISHFMLDQTGRKDFLPFKYKDRNRDLIPNSVVDFKIVIPEPEEIIYPKKTSNGFLNPHAARILEGDFEGGTVLICAGFMAYDCLMGTATGSFNVSANSDKHKVILVNDARNEDAYYEGDDVGSSSVYLDLLRKDLRSQYKKENIGIADTAEILGHLESLR